MSSLHIVSTGISLLTNYVKSNPEKIEGLSNDNAHNYSQQIECYLEFDPTKACGEINALYDRIPVWNGRNDDLQITLIYTETDQGKCIASLLEKFLKPRVRQIHRIPVRGFDKPATDATKEYAQSAATESLKQLDAKVTEHITRMKNQVDTIELNCTGGYKAESAVLYALGNRLKIPVYYMHESFRCCVEMPLL